MTLEEYLADPQIDERAEYLFGEVYEPAAESFLHTLQSVSIERTLSGIYGRERVVRKFFVPAYSHYPRPDVAVVRKDLAHYKPDGYGSSEVLLVVEVCQSTQAVDYELKNRIYANEGIPEYWIVDLDRRSLVQHTVPGAQGYLRTARLRPGDQIFGIPVNEIIGEPSPEDPPGSV